MKMLFRPVWASLAALCLSVTATVSAQDSHPGRAVYEQSCAACHNQPGTRAPALSALQEMSAQALRFALTEGIMAEQGGSLAQGQLEQVVDYLAPDLEGGDWIAAMMCNADKRVVDLSEPKAMTQFGVDHNSTRHLTAGQAGLDHGDLANLELAWAIGFPGVGSLRAAPVVIGSTLFYHATLDKLLAMDVASACVKWVYDAGMPLRTSIAYGELGDSGKQALIVADRRGQVHALDAKSGASIWKADARHSERAGITGAPVLFEDKVIVPISASGVGSGANPRYECCSEHGAVVALNAETGDKLWTYHTMEDATYTGETSRTGVKLRGPSGAPIWSTPTIDAERGLVYATTGQNTSLPATDTSDAVLAIDIETGELKWSFQALANDVWNLACREPWEQSGPNCPSPDDSVLKDFDFGAAAILVQRDDGKDTLLAGQKSGDVWALNPDNGELLWNKTFGQGTPLGGVHWGMASDGERVFAPINDPFAATGEFVPKPGLNALDVETGEVLWQKPVAADCSPARKERYDRCDEKYGLSAAVLSIDGAVVAGALDGRLYVHDAETGEVIWQYDTLRDFNTLNGVEGKGGGIDSHSIAAGSGMLFIGSGYGSFGQPPGNVLLAFKPKANE